ncbi:hypothetical protein [Halomicrococcus sp. NG-SE-24]|uniref:hypothetical protein n=1 Tax=Halomicrococcus sp. NG-SE-24 TaxID=3436928 RepID=UPI003D988DD6
MTDVKDQTVDDQNKLIELIQNQGWDITALELKEYQSGFSGDVMGAEIDLTIKTDYSDEDDQNPYRVN